MIFDRWENKLIMIDAKMCKKICKIELFTIINNCVFSKVEIFEKINWINNLERREFIYKIENIGIS